MELSTRYNPQEVERFWYRVWDEHGYFKPSPNPKLNPFTIVIPPPNVTDILHLGHALNNTIQDIYTRYRRMQGFAVLWVPGVDHAGIATQVIVEKEVLKDTPKEKIGREKFVELISQWAIDKKATIIEQLKELGCSCDWGRLKFTLSPEMSAAVYEAFIRLYKKGWIYKGDYIVNWCPRCETALSDEEVEHKEENGNLYYIKYPIKTFNSSPQYPGASIVVATTRPETMLGDTACAVNPKDTKNAPLVGKTVILPLMGREIPIIADERVDPNFGTGIVKITPAHDPVDFEIAEHHNLPKILIMNKMGRINENGGKYKGMARVEARTQILNSLKEMGLLAKIEPYRYSVGHCYRCDTIIEPMLSKQWFVRQKELAKPAITAVEEGEVKFYPERWKGVYLNWMYNIKDWCISRQIWWGHQLPVYYCNGCGEVIVDKKKPQKCPKCTDENLVQDPDVLDTWFSSWLWPISTLGWPTDTEDIRYFYPTSLLVTAPEIIFFWVARMIMAGYEFMGKPPFRDVYIHGTVRDAIGRKMSKSLGNGIDPRDIVAKYGTDALRFSLITAAGEGHDPHIQENTFEVGRDFTNKIWNAYRLLTMLPDSIKRVELADRWILSHQNRLIKDVTDLLDRYKLHEPAMRIYEFFWHKFCDWYLEIIKIRGDKGVAIQILENTLKLLHPFIPFITEEIWQKIEKRDASIMISEWPIFNPDEIDPNAELEFEFIQNIIIRCRNIRAEFSIPKSKSVRLIVRMQENFQNYKKVIDDNAPYIKAMGKVEEIEYAEEIPTQCVPITYRLTKGVEVFIPLAGLIDLNKELRKLEAEYTKIKELLNSARLRLESPNFVNKALPKVIEATQEKIKEYEQKLLNLELYIQLLQRG